MSDQVNRRKYLLLEELLAVRGLALKGTYKTRDVAAIFDVSTRAIQERVRRGELTARDLPGRARFLSEDLEAYLQRSYQGRRRPRGGE